MSRLAGERRAWTIKRAGASEVPATATTCGERWPSRHSQREVQRQRGQNGTCPRVAGNLKGADRTEERPGLAIVAGCARQPLFGGCPRQTGRLLGDDRRASASPPAELSGASVFAARWSAYQRPSRTPDNSPGLDGVGSHCRTLETGTRNKSPRPQPAHRSTSPSGGCAGVGGWVGATYGWSHPTETATVNLLITNELLCRLS